MSKAIFFDWDDTLVTRLKPVELIEARKFLGADQIVQIRDSDRYTTKDVINLMADLTDSPHPWFIVSNGDNQDQYVNLKDQEEQKGNIFDTYGGYDGQKWGGTGLKKKKEQAIQELINRFNLTDAMDNSIMVEDTDEVLVAINKGQPRITIHIQPGIGIGEQTIDLHDIPETQHLYPSGSISEGTIIAMEPIEGVPGLVIPRTKTILNKEKIDVIRNILGLPTIAERDATIHDRAVLQTARMNIEYIQSLPKINSMVLDPGPGLPPINWTERGYGIYNPLPMQSPMPSAAMGMSSQATPMGMPSQAVAMGMPSQTVAMGMPSQATAMGMPRDVIPRQADMGYSPDLSKRINDLKQTLDMFRSEGYPTGELESQIAQLQTQISSMGMPSQAAAMGMPSQAAAMGMPRAHSHLSSHSQNYNEEAALAAAILASEEQAHLEGMREPEPELEHSPIHSEGVMSFNKESIMAQLHEALTLHSLAETKKDKEGIRKTIDRLKSQLAQIQRNERMLVPSHSPFDVDYSTMIWVDPQNPEAVAKLSSYKNIMKINELLYNIVGYTRDVKKAIMKHIKFNLSKELFERNTRNIPLTPQKEREEKHKANSEANIRILKVFNVFMAMVWHHGKTKMNFFPLSNFLDYAGLGGIHPKYGEIINVLDNPIRFMDMDYLEVYKQPHMGDLYDTLHGGGRRGSVRRSSRGSVRRSARKSPRKSARKSARKSVRKSARKSARILSLRQNNKENNITSTLTLPS